MENGVDVVDKPHVQEIKLPEHRVQEDKEQKIELVGFDEVKDEDGVFEEAIGSEEDFPEQGQNHESIWTDGGTRDNMGLKVAIGNSVVGDGVENNEEPFWDLDEASDKELTEDEKAETSVDAESVNAVEEKLKIDGGAETETTSHEVYDLNEDSEFGANSLVEVLDGVDEVDVNSDSLIQNAEFADVSLENANGHSFENGDFVDSVYDLNEDSEFGSNDGVDEVDVNSDSLIQNAEFADASLENANRHSLENGDFVDSVDASAGPPIEKQDLNGREIVPDFVKMNKAREEENATELKDCVVNPSLLNVIDERKTMRETNHLDVEDGGKQNTDGRNASDDKVSGDVKVLDNIIVIKENNEAHEHQESKRVNGENRILENPKVNSENEIQQKPLANGEHTILQSRKANEGHGNQSISSSTSATSESRNGIPTPPSAPAGLGRAARLLEPAPRVSQPSRVNGTVSHPQTTQEVEDSSNGENDEHDETREQLQMIRVKFLRLAHRLGQTPHNVVVAQVLYRLGLAEQLRGRTGSRVGAFSFDRASAMAEQLETSGNEALDFSCTIMVIGKSGVGKSATINSIFDEVKFSTDAFQMGTTKVQDVVGFVQGIKVRVIDTPGLLPSWSDQHQNEKVLHSVRRFIKKTPPDIVLYLDRLDMQSRDFGDMPLLRTISDIFGPSIWFNAIVVLTHAASAPPDGPNGTASSYDMFVTQRSHVIQQAIRQAAGDMRLMNPVSLVENHSACRTNRAGQRVLPNGQVWKPHLLLLSFASKILAEANALLKLQDNNIPGKPFTARSKSPPLPFLLSSLLQSRPHVKLPDEQFDDEEDLGDDLDNKSDSGDDSDYDQLPPFKPLTNGQLAKLSRAQKKEYLDELEYREKLFMKKQLKEEKRRHKMMKKLAAMAKELADENVENIEEETGGPASVPVPMPDLALPASFDSENPTHRYRCLDSSNQWLVRPVLDSHGWDHDVGYEGVNVERLFVVKEKMPVSFSGQVTKDKKDANVQMEVSSTIKHGDMKSTSLGFDMQNVGKDLAYTLRSEMRFNKLRRNKAAAGLSVTLLGDSVSAGMKIEDKLIANKRFRLVMSGGAMTGQGEIAYGGSLEAQLRDKDYPLGRFLSTAGLSVMEWHGDLAIGGNLQSQLPIGRSSTLVARANLNNRGAGQVSIRLTSSDQLQIALVALLPLFKKLLSYPQLMQYGQ